MGKIMKSGIEYSGGSSSGDSKKIKYDNTNSGLESTNVQDAIDEITGSGKILNLQTTLLLDNITNESYTSYGADISYSNYYIEVSIQGSVSLPFYIMNMEVGKKYRCAFAANVYIDLEFKEDKVYISIAKGNYESIYVSIYGIQGISTTGAEVVDNLESTDSEAALSANMGRELKEALQPICDLLVDTNVSSYTAFAVSDLSKYKNILLCAIRDGGIVESTNVPISLFRTLNSSSNILQARYTTAISANTLSNFLTSCYYSSDTEIFAKTSDASIITCKIYGIN